MTGCCPSASRLPSACGVRCMLSSYTYFCACNLLIVDFHVWVESMSHKGFYSQTLLMTLAWTQEMLQHSVATLLLGTDNNVAFPCDELGASTTTTIMNWPHTWLSSQFPAHVPATIIHTLRNIHRTAHNITLVPTFNYGNLPYTTPPPAVLSPFCRGNTINIQNSKLKWT